MQGEGGRGKNMILYCTGEGGVWRGAKLYYIINEWPLSYYACFVVLCLLNAFKVYLRVAK